MLVVLFATPLWYANSVNFRAQLHRAVRGSRTAPRAIVLDAIGMTDIDFTGARALGAALDELDRSRIAFAVARAGDHAREGLARSGLLERIGERQFFPAVDEPVQAMTGTEVGAA